ncbi:hypothetical protein BGY98DRAFT_317046 [Russula aff. rugulosa BPL654]|nr:hypothetical protein BGY98DRAFT_317046 [Russula aff. rugulosa BPL654]
MTGETHNTAMSGPIGIITTIGVSAILGWFLIRVILILLYSIRDYGTTVASPTDQQVTQIFLETVWKKVAVILMVIVIGAMFHLRVRMGSSPVSIYIYFSVTSKLRMTYTSSHDGAVPGSRFLHKVDHRWRSQSYRFALPF